MINQEADMYSRAMEKYRGKCEELEAKLLKFSHGLDNDDMKKIDDRIFELESKLQVAVEALEEYTDTAYDSHDYTAKDITHYAKEALEKIKDN